MGLAGTLHEFVATELRPFLEAWLESLRRRKKKRPAEHEFGQGSQEPLEWPDIPLRTPWSFGNGGSQYGGGEGGGPGSYVTHPDPNSNPGQAVYDAFRRKVDAAAEALRAWQAENEQRRRAGLPPLPWVGVGGI